MLTEQLDDYQQLKSCLFPDINDWKVTFENSQPLKRKSIWLTVTNSHWKLLVLTPTDLFFLAFALLPEIFGIHSIELKIAIVPFSYEIWISQKRLIQSQSSTAILSVLLEICECYI